ncbi:NTP transferase domain-containing protein [Patescibacteria group bacterium]|nr:NTP transferase domain-containing protein [Patescibacteria group bacterium]MBU1613019.1 NTP transferase domain-containing protein [Patescibacteria group bacterium]
MNLLENKIGIVVLAAGKGKRMQSDTLKVMNELNGRPLIDYVVQVAENLDLAEKPIVVVRAGNPAVQNFLGDRAQYVEQEEQLGTGHAVGTAENILKDKVDHVVVLYGDMPFVTADSIKKLIDKHLEKNNELTLITVVVPDFNEWRANLCDYGRVVRGVDGHIVGIVEKKDAAPEQLEIKEVNTSFFCFKSDWLWENLQKLKNENAQGEYYLTDLVKLAFESGAKLSAVSVGSREALGINTKEHLEIARTI